MVRNRQDWNEVHTSTPGLKLFCSDVTIFVFSSKRTSDVFPFALQWQEPMHRSFQSLQFLLKKYVKLGNEDLVERRNYIASVQVNFRNRRHDVAAAA